MRKAAFASLLAVLAAAAVTASPAVPATPVPICAKQALTLVKPGTLTVGTDNPAYPPWFGGSAGHGWKVSDPTSGKGYESAVAYAVAQTLGFSPSEVSWTYVPFNRSFAPGK
jgi:polar amino acid transport system substrate-binding protein